MSRDLIIVARVAAAFEPAGPDDTAHDPLERVREVLREVAGTSPLVVTGPATVRADVAPMGAACAKGGDRGR